MSQWLNLGQLATRAGRLLPTIDHLISWFTSKTRDGKTLLNNVKSSEFEGLLFDGATGYVATEPVALGNNFEFEWTGSLDADTQSYGVIFGNKTTTTIEGGFFLERVSNFDRINFVAYPNNGTRQVSTQRPVDFFDGSIRTHKVTVNNGALIYEVDDVEIASYSFTIADGFTDSESFGIYARQNGHKSTKGTLQNFKLTISDSTAFDYDFSANSGDIVYDQSGNGNNGTIIGDALWNRTQGELTDVNCLQFSNNNTQVVTLPVATPFDVGVVLSADIVVTGDSGGVAEAIFGEDSNHCFGVTSGGGDRYPRFRANVEDNYIEFTDITVSENTPYNIKFERTATDEVVCTVVDLEDNTTQAQTVSSLTPAQQLYLNTTDIIELGRSGIHIDSHIKIANAKVGDYFYPLQEGSGTTVYDISGNGNHGTITGATWTTEDGIESWNHEYGFDSSIIDSDNFMTVPVTLTGMEEVDSGEVGVRKFTKTAATGGNGFVTFGSYPSLSNGDSYSLKYTIKTDSDSGASNLIWGGQTIASSRATGNNNTYTTHDISATSPNKPSSGNNSYWGIAGKTFSGADYTPNTNGIGIFTYANHLEQGESLFIKDMTLDIATKIPALNTKTKQVATFDGAADIIYTIQPATSSSVSRDMTVRFKVPASSSNNKPLMTAGTTGKSFGVQVNQSSVSATMGIRDASSGASGLVTLNLPAIGTLAEIRMQWDGALVTGTVTNLEDNTSISGTTTPTLDGTGICDDDSTLIIAGSNQLSGASAKFQGEFLFAGYTEGGVKKFEYDFQNDIGTTTIQDLTANDNDGTVTVGSDGLESFWGTRVADNDGVLVSADYATGNTSISNPAGFVHNNSECGVKLQSRTVGTFDGTDDQVDTGYQTTGDFVVDARIKPHTITNQKAIHSCNGNSGYWLRISNGELQLYVAGGYLIGGDSGTSNSFASANTLYDTRVEYTASTNSWVLKAKETTDNTYTNLGSGTATPNFGTANVVLGQKGGGQFFDGEYHSFKLTDGGVEKVEYNFSEAQGNTIYDRSGNDNNGSLTVSSSGLETFWADSYQEYQRIDLNEGFVPAQLTVTDCTDTSLNGLYELDSTRNNDKLRWLKNNDGAQKIYFNSGSNRWTIQDSSGAVTKSGDTQLPAEGSYGSGANLAYSTQGVFIKTSGTNITQIGQYDGDEALTATEVTRNERYFG